MPNAKIPDLIRIDFAVPVAGLMLKYKSGHTYATRLKKKEMVLYHE